MLVNGTCRKLCNADRRVLEGVLKLTKGERYASEPVWSIRYVTVAILKWMRCLMGSQWSCWRALADVIAELLRINFCQGVLNSLEFMKVWSRCTTITNTMKTLFYHTAYTLADGPIFIFLISSFRFLLLPHINKFLLSSLYVANRLW